MFQPQLPYPKRFKKKALEEKFTKFLEIFKKIHINIQFSDALEKIPNYAKFIKDVMSKKRRLQDNEIVNLTEEYNAILQKKMPQKLKDPDSFTILCYIGGAHVSRVLCDLGASINLMSLSVYRALELGEVKLTTITLQFIDRSIMYPSTAEAKIYVKKGELSVGVDGEKVIFNLFKEVSNPSMEKVFMIKQAKMMKSCRKVESKVVAKGE
ncbi:uncharacterized protein [Henckelia pumila]|uniref:uncharacterized protein n=1 Tax=Henckelia pumila TaxID=405737 RepID=UPI003C6E3AE8